MKEKLSWIFENLQRLYIPATETNITIMKGVYLAIHEIHDELTELERKQDGINAADS